MTTLVSGSGAGITDTSAFSKAKTGDIIVFGTYEQDNNTNNGKEPIDWIVLSNDGKELLVVSKYALTCWSYSTVLVDITWEECTLRKWLNDDFYNDAFSASDKKLIKTTKLKNNDNPVYGTEYGSKGGNDTKDNVFLLSLEDMVNTQYGFSSDYNESDIARRCAPTAYAVAHGAYISWSDGYLTSAGEPACSKWWLRSPGGLAIYATHVDGSGYVFTRGDYVIKEGGVRPALCLTLE